MDHSEARARFFENFKLPEEELVDEIQHLTRVIGKHVFMAHVDKRQILVMRQGLLARRRAVEMKRSEDALENGGSHPQTDARFVSDRRHSSSNRGSHVERGLGPL